MFLFFILLLLYSFITPGQQNLIHMRVSYKTHNNSITSHTSFAARRRTYTHNYVKEFTVLGAYKLISCCDTQSGLIRMRMRWCGRILMPRSSSRVGHFAPGNVSVTFIAAAFFAWPEGHLRVADEVFSSLSILSLISEAMKMPFRWGCVANDSRLRTLRDKTLLILRLIREPKNPHHCACHPLRPVVRRSPSLQRIWFREWPVRWPHAPDMEESNGHDWHVNQTVICQRRRRPTNSVDYNWRLWIYERATLS